MFRAPRCPNCRREYAGQRYQGGSFQPLILQCGHTFCRTCLTKIQKLLKHELACPQCKASTPMPMGDASLKDLMPDFYALGLAAWTFSRTQDVFAHRVEFQARPSREKFEGKSLKGGRPLCEECSHESATCECQQCDQEFCEKCWAKLHHANSKSKSPHQRIHIQIGVYGCEEHDNMPKDFYCTEDNVPICAYCGLTGSHRGHQITPIQDQNALVQDRLRPAFETAKGVLKRLYYSKLDLEKASVRVKREMAPAAEAIRSSFQVLHSLLQCRESMLLQELHSMESSRLDLLQQMGQSVKNNISRLETVMSDVAKSFKGNTGPEPNLTEMIDILNSSAELPCHVVSEGGLERSVSFSSPDDIAESLMSHGAIETGNTHGWDLKTAEELPEGFELKDIPDSILSNSKLFTVSGNGKTEMKSPKRRDAAEAKSTHDNHTPISTQQPAKKPSSSPSTRAQPLKTVKVSSTASKELVYVVHIKTPACFYVQRKSQRAQLAKVMKVLNKLCESEDKKKRIPDPLVQGLRCCCKFSVDNQWYRAIVKTIPASLQNGGMAAHGGGGDEEEPQVEVVYIDYGNSEWVPISRLCKIRPKYERQPDLAQCCSLVDIVSTQQDGRWSREASEAFQAMVQGQEAVLMTVSGQVGNMLYVDLHQQPNNSIKDDMPVSLRDALVFLELACFISPESIPKAQTVLPPKKYLPPDIPKKGDELVVQVSHITDPQDFSVQDLEMVEYIDEMMERIQKVYGSTAGSDWQVLCPHPGQVCMAFFEEDKRWYRAEFVRVAGSQVVEVLYVDYGNKATIHYTYLRKMTDEFLRLSRLALPCRLADVAPKDNKQGWTDESKLFFSKCVSFKPTDINVMDVHQGVLSVLAFEGVDEGKVCVNALMVQKGMAETTGPGSMSAELLRSPCPAPTKQPPGTEIGVSTTPADPHGESNSHQSAESATTQEKSPPAAEEGATSSPATPAQSQDRQPLPQKEDRVTGDVGAPDAKADSVAEVDTPKSQSPSPAVEVVEESAPKRDPAVPVRIGSGNTTSSQLSGKYSAYTAVHVSHVESPACIYVQLSTAGKDGLDSLLEAMTVFYKEQPPVKDKEWAEQDICGALLVREGVWCRGKIQCLLPNDNVVVLFTDYGNTEVVSATHIRPLAPRFQREAPFATKCHLADILPAGGTAEWTKTSCDFLEERLNDLECYICKKGAAVSGNLPIDLLYELTDKEKVARESLEDLASISELLIQKGLALRKRRKTRQPAEARNVTMPAPPSQEVTPPVKSPTKYPSPLNSQSSGSTGLSVTCSPSPSGIGYATPEGHTTPNDDNEHHSAPACSPDFLDDDSDTGSDTVTQEPLLQYVAAPLPLLSQLQLIITFVSPEGIIHGLEVDKFQEFQLLMEVQQKECNSQTVAPLGPGSVSLGQCLCARFSLDNMWYRARVIGISEDCITVKYIDFGNTEEVPFDRVLTSPYRLDIPQHSRECVLYGVQPKSPNQTWSSEAITFLLEMLVEQTCTAHIKAMCVKGEPLKVELALPTGESATRVLLNHGFAKLQPDFEDFDAGCPDDTSTITDGTSTPAYSRAMSEDGDDVLQRSSGLQDISRVVDVLQGVAEMEEDQQVMAVAGQPYVPIILPDVGVNFLVSVTHLDEPDQVFIQYANASLVDQDVTIAMAARQLLEWNSQIEELSSASTALPFLLNPQPDMPCCAQYSADKRWYRALIVSVVRKEIIMCHVQFVDYGTVEWLSLNSIRQLPQKFLDLQAQARRCRLAGIKAPARLPLDTPLQPGTAWPATAITRTVELVTNQILVACVEEDGFLPVISLFHQGESTTPVCQYLIDEGLADPMNRARAEQLQETSTKGGAGREASTGGVTLPSSQRKEAVSMAPPVSGTEE